MIFRAFFKVYNFFFLIILTHFNRDSKSRQAKSNIFLENFK